MSDELTGCADDQIYGHFTANEVRMAAEITRLHSSLAIRDKALEDAKAAADGILVHVTMYLGRYLYDAPDVDLVPLLAKDGVKITGKQFMALFNATDAQALSPNTTDAK